MLSAAMFVVSGLVMGLLGYIQGRKDEKLAWLQAQARQQRGWQ
jgi:hypothetical protein